MREEYIYRIKTIAEFEKDFGPSWRDRVRCSFPNRMDHLLGQELSKSEYESALNVTSYKGFNISKDMVTAEYRSSIDVESFSEELLKILNELDKNIKEDPIKQTPSKKISFPF